MKAQDGIYNVSTPNELAYMFFKVISNPKNNSTRLTIRISLKNNIDLGNHYWSAITTKCNLEFDGNLHIIYGFKSADVQNGLISASSGGNITFKNVTIQYDIHVTKSEKTNIGTGGFVGGKTSGNLTFENCKTMGSISIDAKSENACVGGFVGLVYSTHVTKCTNSVNINCDNSTFEINSVGGFVGKSTNSCKFSLCSNYGELSGCFMHVGGLIGYATGIDLYSAKSCNNAVINSIYNKKIIGFFVNSDNYENGYVGGLVGYVKSSSNSTISFVYNTQNISSKGNSGGIIGFSECDFNFHNIYNSGNVSAHYPLSNSLLYHDRIVETVNYNGDINYFKFKDMSGKYDIQMEIDSVKYIYESPIDISLVGNDSKIKSKDNCYSVKPLCVLGNDGYVYSVDIKFIEYQSGFSNELHSLTLRTGLLSTYKDQDTCSFAYGKPGYTDYNNKITNYTKNIAFDIYEGNVYYENSLFDNNSAISSWYNATYNFVIDGDKYNTRLYDYLNRAMIYMMYSEMESTKYKNKGLDKTWAMNGIPYQFFNDGYDIGFVGARMYLCFNSDSTCLEQIRICPLCKAHNSVIKYKNSSGEQVTLNPCYVPLSINNRDIRISVNENINLGFYRTKEEIKKTDLDKDIYGINAELNDGLPVFKEMYWEFG